MRILLASSSFHGGGITSYALELINCYAADNEFYLMIKDTNGFVDEKAFPNIIHEDMNDLSATNADNVAHIINKLNPDVLIVSFARVVGLILPFLNNNIRIITVSHSLRYDEADMAAMNAPYTDRIIALSRYNMVYLRDKFGIKEDNKIQVVYNCIKPTTERPSVEEKKALTHEPVIVFAGGGAPTKSPELVHSVLMDLLKTPAKFRFYWLGNTNPPLKKVQFLKKIEQLVPDDPRVTFTGKIPRSEATAILNRANIILIPSRREGCPMTLIEAMSAGVIVVTSDYENGCREIVESAKCGKVLPHKNTKEFTRTLLDIIGNPTAYDYCYDAAKEYFEEKLSYAAWRNEMDKLLFGTDTQHQTRISFSSVKYVNILVRWKICSFFNAIHMLLVETFPSALSFFNRNMHYKHGRHYSFYCSVKTNNSNKPSVDENSTHI